MALDNNNTPLTADERIERRQQERVQRAKKERRTALIGTTTILISVLCGAIYFLCCDIDDFGWGYILGGICFFLIIGKIGQWINILLGRPPGAKF